MKVKIIGKMQFLKLAGAYNNKVVYIPGAKTDEYFLCQKVEIINDGCKIKFKRIGKHFVKRCRRSHNIYFSCDDKGIFTSDDIMVTKIKIIDDTIEIVDN